MSAAWSGASLCEQNWRWVSLEAKKGNCFLLYALLLYTLLLYTLERGGIGTPSRSPPLWALPGEPIAQFSADTVSSGLAPGPPR